MRPTDLALGIPAQHAGYLVHSAASFEHRDVGGRNSTFRAFRYDDVVMRASRDLRQMGDREYLMLLRDAAQRVANLKSYSSADSGIDLVEYQCRHTVHASENRLERQHHPRQLSARCHSRQRTILVADVERDTNLDVLRAFGGRLVARDE